MGGRETSLWGEPSPLPGSDHTTLLSSGLAGSDCTNLGHTCSPGHARAEPAAIGGGEPQRPDYQGGCTWTPPRPAQEAPGVMDTVKGPWKGTKKDPSSASLPCAADGGRSGCLMPSGRLGEGSQCWVNRGRGRGKQLLGGQGKHHSRLALGGAEKGTVWRSGKAGNKQPNFPGLGGADKKTDSQGGRENQTGLAGGGGAGSREGGKLL